MTHLFDEFSKSLDEAVPRRESLRRFGAVLAGAILSPLASGAAWAAGTDPCKSFCRCSNKSQQTKCLAACRACNGDTSRVCGRCGTHVCCSGKCCGGVCTNLASDPNCGACGNNCGAVGETCCGAYCADLADDFYNCGACGNACTQALPNERGACIDGTCFYDCAEGAIECDGACVNVDADPNNCGACGNVCGGETPYCSDGACTNCGGGWSAMCNGVCIDILFDALNCGGCGHQCQPLEHCSWGTCEGVCIGCE